MHALRYVREQARHLVPAPGLQRMLQIAIDTARRGDVRQIAWLLARQSVDGLEQPCTPDLVEHAAEVIDRCLKTDSFRVRGPQGELLQYLVSERATLLVTELFVRCFREVFEDQGYMAGNDVVLVVGTLGRKFVPDILHFLSSTSRHFGTLRPPVPTGIELMTITLCSVKPGHLAVGWQIAWTLARAGLLDLITGLAPFLDSPDKNERLPP